PLELVGRGDGENRLMLAGIRHDPHARLLLGEGEVVDEENGSHREYPKARLLDTRDEERREPDKEGDDAEDEVGERLLEAEGTLTDVKPGDVEAGFAARTGCGLVPSLPIDVIIIDFPEANQGHQEGDQALPSCPDLRHLGRAIDV